VAQDAGADAVVLCDTNGGSLVNEIEMAVKKVRPLITVALGIHAHNDSGLAAANSIAAVQQGCDHIQGTVNGYGERCGNADLVTVIPLLQLKLGIGCIPEKKLHMLTEVSHYVSEVSNMKHQDNHPFVGWSAFAHKGGVHINAVTKDSTTYEHIPPEKVGNRRRFLISELSGRTTILLKARQMELNLRKGAPKTKRVLKLLQNLERQGYQFEAAEGSFDLLMRKSLKKYKKFFTLQGFRVVVEKEKDGRVVSEATVKLRVKNLTKHTVAEGDGPVNALDRALRKALTDIYPNLAQMHLSDFKVRVLDEKAGTAAKVRVLIQSQDEKSSWSTVGVSENIIEASWQGLLDSIEYKLLKDRTKI
jgi:2-isopropylmalate synthase